MWRAKHTVQNRVTITLNVSKDSRDYWDVAAKISGMGFKCWRIKHTGKREREEGGEGRWGVY